MVTKEGDFRDGAGEEEEEEEEAHFLYHRRRDGKNKATCSLSWKGGRVRFYENQIVKPRLAD